MFHKFFIFCRRDGFRVFLMKKKNSPWKCARNSWPDFQSTRRVSRQSAPIKIIYRWLTRAKVSSDVNQMTFTSLKLCFSFVNKPPTNQKLWNVLNWFIALANRKLISRSINFENTLRSQGKRFPLQKVTWMSVSAPLVEKWMSFKKVFLPTLALHKHKFSSVARRQATKFQIYDFNFSLRL